MKFFKNKNYPQTQTSNSINQSKLKPDHIQGQSYTSLVESSFIKQKISKIIDKMEILKNSHKREKSQLLEEFKCYQIWVMGMVDIMAIRIKEEGKKNKFFEKEVNRLKMDISVLKQINQEFSIKLNSQKSLSHLSYDMNSTKNFDSRFTNQNDKENSRDLVNTFGSGQHHQNSCHNYSGQQSKIATFGRKNFQKKFLKNENFLKNDVTDCYDSEGKSSISNLNSSVRSERITKLKQRSKELANQRRLRDINNYYDKENNNFKEFDLSKKYMKSENYDNRAMQYPSPKPFTEFGSSNRQKFEKTKFQEKSPISHFHHKTVTERSRSRKEYGDRVLTERSMMSEFSEDEKSQFVLTEKSYLDGTAGGKYEIHHIKFHTGSVNENLQLKQINEMESLDNNSSISDDI